MKKGILSILQSPSSRGKAIWVWLSVGSVSYTSSGATLGGGRRANHSTTPATAESHYRVKRSKKHSLHWGSAEIFVADGNGSIEEIMDAVFETFRKSRGTGVGIPTLLRNLAAPSPITCSLGAIVPEATWIF